MTHRCRENCFFCFVDKDNLSIGVSKALKAADLFLKAPGTEKTIKFFGGDPLLEFKTLKQTVNFCEKKARELGKRVNFILPTPGTVLDKKALDLIQRHNIELILNSSQIRDISKPIIKKALTLTFTTLTVNVTPASVRHLSASLKKYYSLGFNRFNLLPVYYIKWPPGGIKALERELKKIGVFYRKHPAVYFKNFELSGEVPLFNSCLTCDVSGELFASNAVLFKSLAVFRDDLLVGDIRKIGSHDKLAKQAKPLQEIVEKAFPADILRSTFRLDRALNSFFGSLRRPVKMADIKMGNSCNNSCKFCVRRKKGEVVPNKTGAQVIKNLIEARRECQGVVFTGGEPSIRKDLFELISYARRLGYERILVQSNGRMFSYKDFCQRAIEAGVNEFELAIHGHIPQLHDYLTSAEGSFYQVVNAIKNIKSLGVPVFTNTVITKSNYRHLDQIARLLVDLGVDQFQFAFAHALGQAAENFDSVVPRMSMVVPYAKKGLQIGINSGVRVMTEAIPYCLLGEYGDYAAENIIPSTRIFELFGKVMDFDKVRLKMAKTKGPNCRKCKFYASCEGIWGEYPEKFGWEEFKPVL